MLMLVLASDDVEGYFGNILNYFNRRSEKKLQGVKYVSLLSAAV